MGFLDLRRRKRQPDRARDASVIDMIVDGYELVIVVPWGLKPRHEGRVSINGEIRSAAMNKGWMDLCDHIPVGFHPTPKAAAIGRKVIGRRLERVYLSPHLPSETQFLDGFLTCCKGRDL